MKTLTSIVDAELVSKAALQARESPILEARISLDSLAKYVDGGWSVEKSTDRFAWIRKEKEEAYRWEDEVWSLIYHLGFGEVKDPELGSEALLTAGGLSFEVDNFGIDESGAIVVECKTSRNPEWTDIVAKLIQQTECMAEYVSEEYEGKLPVAGVLAICGRKALPKRAQEMARKAGIAVLNAHDVAYFQDLAQAQHIGSEIARLQFMAQVFGGRPIQAERLVLPAIENRRLMTPSGKECTQYTFFAKGSELLPLVAVNHRAAGAFFAGSGGHGYQRALVSKKVKEIAKGISEEGFDGFPTNVVLGMAPTLEPKFVPARPRKRAWPKGGELSISQVFKGFTIIDGQHRLLALIKEPGALEKAEFPIGVTAYFGLDLSDEMNLFVEINQKQTGIKAADINEMYRHMYWDAPHDDFRNLFLGVCSQIVHDLGKEDSSFLFTRIKDLAPRGTDKAASRITFQAVWSELSKANYLRKGTGGGLLWIPAGQRTNEKTRVFAIGVLNGWLELVFGESAPGAVAWDAGRGWAATNRGLVVALRCFRVLATDYEAKCGSPFRAIGDRKRQKYLNGKAKAVSNAFSGLHNDRLALKEFQERAGMAAETEGLWDIVERLPKGLQVLFPEAESKLDLRKMDLKSRAQKIGTLMEESLAKEVTRRFEEKWPGIGFSNQPAWIYKAWDHNDLERLEKAVKSDDESSVQIGDVSYGTNIADWAIAMDRHPNLFEDLSGLMGFSGFSWVHKWNDLRKRYSHRKSSTGQITLEDVHILSQLRDELAARIPIPE